MLPRATRKVGRLFTPLETFKFTLLVLLPVGVSYVFTQEDNLRSLCDLYPSIAVKQPPSDASQPPPSEAQLEEHLRSIGKETR